MSDDYSSNLKILKDVALKQLKRIESVNEKAFHWFNNICNDESESYAYIGALSSNEALAVSSRMHSLSHSIHMQSPEGKELLCTIRTVLDAIAIGNS